MLDEVLTPVANEKSHLLKLWRWLFFCSLLALLISTSYLSQQRIDSIKSKIEPTQELLYVPYSKNFSYFTLGYGNIISDLLYIRAVGYFGHHYLTDKNYPYLYNLIEASTDMDPYFKDAYEFGAIVLSLEAGQAQNSIFLLRKAISYNPDYWRYPFYMSFNYFFFLQDYQKAAFYMREAAELEGGPDYLKPLAARLYVQAGRPEVGLRFLEQMYRQVDDERLKKEIFEKIEEIKKEI